MDLKTLQLVQQNVEELLSQVDVDFVQPTVEMEEADTIKVDLKETTEGNSEEDSRLGLLIGSGGDTLRSIEYILALMINKDREEWYRVVVDIDGYRERREEELKQLAYKTADRVRMHGSAVELKPMSGADRRIVHMALSSMPEVTTESTGEGRYRRLVVLPAGESTAE